MIMSDLKVFFAPGTCARVTLIALEKIGANFDTELIVFMRGDHRKPEFLKLNPAGKVPCLTVNGTALVQNPAILSYLDATYPEAKLLPAANSDLEKALNLSKLVKFSADLHPLVTRIRMPQFFCDIENTPARVREMGMAGMAFQLAAYEEELSKSPWLNGDNWGAYDAYLHWVWWRITGAGFDGSKFPAISAHFAKTLELPEVKAVMKREEIAEKWLDENGFGLKLK
jgi:glutathione S-transferase